MPEAVRGIRGQVASLALLSLFPTGCRSMLVERFIFPHGDPPPREAPRSVRDSYGKLPLVIGNRGTGVGVEENTRSGVRNAITLGANRAHVTVRLSENEKPVAIYYQDVDHTTDGFGSVAKLSSRELRKLDAGDGYGVPKAKQLLQDLGKIELPGVLQIEILEAKAARLVVEQIEKRGFEDQVVITAKSLAVVARVHALNPKILLGVIWDQVPSDICAQTKQSGAEEIHLHNSEITPMLMEQAHGCGLRVVASDADSEAVVRRLIALNVDGIQSNHPRLVREYVVFGGPQHGESFPNNRPEIVEIGAQGRVGASNESPPQGVGGSGI